MVYGSLIPLLFLICSNLNLIFGGNLEAQFLGLFYCLSLFLFYSYHLHANCRCYRPAMASNRYLAAAHFLYRLIEGNCNEHDRCGPIGKCLSKSCRIDFALPAAAVAPNHLFKGGIPPPS